MINTADCQLLGCLGGDVFLGDRRFIWWQIPISDEGWSAVTTGNLPHVTAKVWTAIQVTPSGEGKKWWGAQRPPQGPSPAHQQPLLQQELSTCCHSIVGMGDRLLMATASQTSPGVINCLSDHIMCPGLWGLFEPSL